MFITDSAHRHGVDDTEIVHAMNHRMATIHEDDMIVAVGGTPSGLLLEVGYLEEDGVTVVIHAMRARAKYLRGF